MFGRNYRCGTRINLSHSVHPPKHPRRYDGGRPRFMNPFHLGDLLTSPLAKVVGVVLLAGTIYYFHHASDKQEDIDYCRGIISLAENASTRDRLLYHVKGYNTGETCSELLKDN